ncbi:MAG: hypothetical protein C4B56_04535 [Candidatus Methanophagaceae archaeon]|nr:MAG: hypothetical protein C4B56_04535 [Methanophagales archaeon]
MKNRYVIAPIVMLAVLAASSVPVLAACGDVVTVKTGTVTNGKVIMQEGPGGTSWSFTVPNGDVQFVRVHWHCWMQSGDSSATFTNSQGQQQQITIPMNTQTDTYGHWECGFGTSHNYWTVNATPGINTLSGITNCDCMWKFVDIVVDNTTEPATHNGRWWLNQGLWKEEDCVASYTTWFNGSINTNANHTVWAAQSHHEYAKLFFNGAKVFDGCADGWFDVWQKSVSNINSGMSQNLTWWNDCSGCGGGYEGFFVWAAMLAEEVSGGNPDLVVSDIEFQPETPRPHQNFTVNATILNQGNAGTGVAFNVSLWIDGSFHDKVTGVGPLDAGKSTTVSFTNVNLGEDCHNFTVVADCDDNVGESDESNAKSEFHQVGYVIVVRSNSDFNDLENEGLATKVGDTYYIEDLTITNCGGAGITIENTTVPFVINKCTVHHCGYNDSKFIDYFSGICMENVTNGKVTNSAVYNNSDIGISVVKSTHIDITNNTISNHTERPITSYGIEVGKVDFPEETKFINVTCNTLYNNRYGIELIGFNCTVKGNLARNNMIYGVYVYGNDSVIYNNTIENNGNYGIKLYNSSGNYVYWNDLTNNNGGGVQAYDNRGTNHWSTSTQVSYCYNGGTYTNYTGNYWDKWTAPDSNGDGIADAPYALDGGAGAADNYPLVVQWRLCGDVNRDGSVDRGDAAAVRNHWGFGYAICNLWAADVNYCDGFVDRADASAIRNHWGFGYPLNCCKDC